MMNNPFTLNFGLKPTAYISRKVQTDEVTGNFDSDPAPSHIYMITGVRGSGKTVFLTEVEDYFRNQDWIVFDLSIESDLLSAFAARLYNEQKLRHLFESARLNFSFLGFGVEVQGEPPVTDLGTAIEEMLRIVKKQGKKVLIAIDEAVNSPSMRRFASEYQILLRNRYPVFLLMTGLYENIYELQNVNTLTFLYRAPKIALSPLNMSAVAESYQKIFSTSAEYAGEMARLTLGYPYAYQVTGYLCWTMGLKQVTDDLLHAFDEYMAEYVYGKIWEEQSPTKRKILTAMADSGTGDVTKIRESIDMSTHEFSVYRSRLIRQGIVRADGYGRLAFTLPRFREFIQEQYY